MQAVIAGDLKFKYPSQISVLINVYSFVILSLLEPVKGT